MSFGMFRQDIHIMLNAQLKLYIGGPPSSLFSPPAFCYKLIQKLSAINPLANPEVAGQTV